jgi:hypothetical protein
VLAAALDRSLATANFREFVFHALFENGKRLAFAATQNAKKANPAFSVFSAENAGHIMRGVPNGSLRF